VHLLIQSPTLERVTQGHSAWFQCIMKDGNVSGTDVNWYQHLPGQQSKWILTHRIDGRKSYPSGSSRHLKPYRFISNNTYILKFEHVKVSDTAVYRCCAGGPICGQGTRLNVTSE
uniref:Ig-like domain-containing protein n=1 Tax=Callorhinchus milii TaxID=7868 RepID=A0A4W3GZG8_CALMI